MSTKNKTIFQEAVEEAKTIRATAIANAKAALEESFMPHVKEMLSTKLQEMDEEDLEESLPFNEPTISEEEEITSDEDEGLFEEEEINLDEILAELENETSGEEDLNESEEDLEEAKAKDKEKDKKDSKPKPASKPKEDEDEDDEEDEEIGEMTMDELKDLIKDVVADLEGEQGEEMPMDDEMPGDEMPGDEMQDFSPSSTPSMPVSEDLFELKKEKDLFKKKSKKVEEQLNEAMKTIGVLRRELNETNLLNAKLLYMNKIFKSSQSLTEGQKVSIIDTLDKASTVKEAKLIYETLTNSLNKRIAPKSTIKENLGFSSKPSGSTKKIIEVDPVVARWQKIAGIK